MLTLSTGRIHGLSMNVNSCLEAMILVPIYFLETVTTGHGTPKELQSSKTSGNIALMPNMIECLDLRLSVMEV